MKKKFFDLQVCMCDCGEIFYEYFCKRCDLYITDRCKNCHEQHFSEIKRMADLARLKRGISI